jgi:hypothetical protein
MSYLKGTPIARNGCPTLKDAPPIMEYAPMPQDCVSQVENAITRVESLVTSISSVTDRLQKRLQPVLRQDYANESIKAPACGDPSKLVPLSDDIHMLGDRIELMLHNLRSLEERIEL